MLQVRLLRLQGRLFLATVLVVTLLRGASGGSWIGGGGVSIPRARAPTNRFGVAFFARGRCGVITRRGNNALQQHRLWQLAERRQEMRWRNSASDGGSASFVGISMPDGVVLWSKNAGDEEPHDGREDEDKDASSAPVAEEGEENNVNDDGGDGDGATTPAAASSSRATSFYDLGLDKNPANERLVPTKQMKDAASVAAAALVGKNWAVPEPVQKPHPPVVPGSNGEGNDSNKKAIFQAGVAAARSLLMQQEKEREQQQTNNQNGPEQQQAPIRTRRMVARDQDSARLRAALWDENHYAPSSTPFSLDTPTTSSDAPMTTANGEGDAAFAPTSSTPLVPRPAKFYPDIDLSIPKSVYDGPGGSVDLVWDLLRWEALEQAEREPLLVSFLYSTILNHKSLESSLAFLLANRLQSPAMMISTQLQSVIMDALVHDRHFSRCVRADMMAVRDRDPACNCLPDVFLYFKGFHALQSYRVAHHLWNTGGKQVLAKYLQSQVSQIFQIDIHPNATLGSGIMLDHGTGIVIGETVRNTVHRSRCITCSFAFLTHFIICHFLNLLWQATVGHNCSILHHVTLGGSGKQGVLRHPQIGDGVLLGAGATVLGPVLIGTSPLDFITPR